MDKQFKQSLIVVILISVLISSIVGSAMGFWAGLAVSGNTGISRYLGRFFGRPALAPTSQTQVVSVREESSVVDAVEKVNPAVVSIIVTKDLPVIERYYSKPFGSDFFEQFFGGGAGGFFRPQMPQYRKNGTEKREVGGGSGFLVSSDGYIVTNKHVVLDEEAEYTVLMNDESKHKATVLARDPFNDLAILKIEGEDWPHLEIGDSTNLKVGQTVIAIGNALGEFRNTVSTGVISGLSRSITAGGTGLGSEELTGVIQTDAGINLGNSGGPLLNIVGQVIGINTAIAQGAENIGFAIPIDQIKNMYESVEKYGRIVRPWLGVRYVMINDFIAEKNNLDIKEGALIVRGEERTDLAVIPGSPADKAGLRENDIILEIGGEKLTIKNPLVKVIGGHQIGDELELKIMRRGKEKKISLKLEEMK